MATRRTPSQPWIPEIPLSNAASAGLPSAYRAHALAAQDRYQHFARDAALGSLLAQTSAAEAP
ncbi:MAG TPA: hypothetical protein VFU81_10380, partial [Thermomicrobiales bacterium]|nr:hypothetical protein [Thermomicrobiales bacterium]